MSTCLICRSTDRILAEDGPPATGVPVPGAIGRIEAVDVEGDIGLLAAGALDDRIGDVGGAHLLDLVAVEDLDAEIVRRMGADADLDRAVRIDDAVACTARATKEPWSMRLPSSNQVS